MKVIIFGGSFSPPTLAHEEIIRQCLALAGFDEVWLMPSADRADKIISAGEAERLKMLQILKNKVFKDPRLQICDIEYRLPKPTQLNRTVQFLSQEYPNNEFWFVFGGDAYRDMPNWANGEWLQNNLNIIIFSDTKPNQANNTRVKHLKLPARFSQMSSTLARINPKGIVSPEILEYLGLHPIPVK
jgi:nicotinate-nucleotide adenylyltransferase